MTVVSAPLTHSLAEKLALLPAADRADPERLAASLGMSAAELAAMVDDERFWLRPAQLDALSDPAPIVLLMGGRGSGKNRTASNWVINKAYTPGTRIHLVARTVADVRDTVVQGEALALGTPVATPDGFTAMGDLRVGDVVLGADGYPAKVTWVSEVAEGRPCFRVTFGNGTEVVADELHKWRVVPADRRWPVAVRTTAEVYAFTVDQPQSVFSVEVAQPLDLPDVDVPVPPYTLGAWLGDGTSKGAEITTADHEIVQQVILDGFAVGYRHRSGTSRASVYNVLGLHQRLRLAGLLRNKHIPVEYLRASFAQRLALLQGLIDTDGTVDRHGWVSYSGSNRRLVDDVAALVASLGIKPGPVQLRPAHPKTILGRLSAASDHWRFTFRTHVPVARLRRKSERIAKSPSPPSQSSRHYIKSVEPIESVPVRCIAVDNESHEFLVTDRLIATHNSGIIACSPVGFVPEYLPSLRKIVWPNGSLALTFCVTPSHRALTRQGWRTHDNLTVGEDILTLNMETGLSEWQPVEAVNVFGVTDEPVLEVDMAMHHSVCTLSHRWPVTNRNSGVRKWRESMLDLTQKDSLITGAPCADLPTTPKYLDSLVELVAWWTTEGYLANHDAPAHHRRMGVISQSPEVNPGHVANLRRALTETYGPSRPSLRDVREPAWRDHFDGRMQRFFLNDEAVALLTAHAPGKDKMVALGFVTALTRSQLELFVQRVMDGDGTVRKSQDSGWILNQSVRGRLDAVEMAAILLGWTVRVREQFADVLVRPDNPTVGPGRRFNNHALTVTRSGPGIFRKPNGPPRDRRVLTEYTGTVWCPTTANGTWLCENDGTVFFTGNSAAEPSQLRGPQSHATYCDELGAWPHMVDEAGATAWDHVRLSTRLGGSPQILVTTTPRRTPILKDLLAQVKEDAESPHPRRRVSLRRMSTLDNRANLAPEYVAALLDLYAGTSLERQELWGELVDFVDGALFADRDVVPQPGLLERSLSDNPDVRFPLPLSDAAVLTVIGVDPAASQHALRSATGIVVVRSTRVSDLTARRAVVVDDFTVGAADPEVWAARVVEAHRLYSTPQSEAIVVAESNQGGDMVRSVITAASADAGRPPERPIPVALVHSARSKAQRSEPVVMAFRRGVCALATDLPDLVDEMLTWTPDSRWSPNRLDAMVHAVRAVLVDDRPLRRFGPVTVGRKTLKARIGEALSPHRAEREGYRG